MAIQDVRLNPKIREAAIEVFLEKGFSDASLAEICEKAGVTTGAIYTRYKGKEGLFSSIVDPTIEALNIYIEEETIKSIEHVKKLDMDFEFKNMEKGYLEFLDFLYENYQGFKLLLCKSNGSKYSNFLNDIIDKLSKQSYEFIKFIYENRELKTLIGENEYHLIYTATYTAMFEVIIHDFEKKDAIKYYKILNKFFNWENVLGV